MTESPYEVWVTTEDHLKGFRDIYDQATMFDRFRGQYALPPGFPRTTMSRVGKAPLEIPVAILSAGDLTVQAEKVVYLHKPRPRYKGLSDLSFSTPIRNLQINLVEFDYAPFRRFNLPYISFLVRHLSDKPLLVDASALGPFTFLIRRRTNRLFDDMVKAGAVPLPTNNRSSDRGQQFP
jgi:hypothetical protein